MLAKKRVVKKPKVFSDVELKRQEIKRQRAAARKVRKKRAIKNLQQYKNPDGSHKENKIEARMRQIIESLGLFYEAEKCIEWKGKWKRFDFYITNGMYKILIECDGTYYHAQAYHEGNVALNSLSKLQRKNIRNDKFKNEMCKVLGIPLLRFWEDIITRNASEIITCINEEITRQMITFEN